MASAPFAAAIEEARRHEAEVDEWHRQATAAAMAEWDLPVHGDPQTVIRTLDEAFAVSPATSEVNLVVLRRDQGESSPSECLASVYAGTHSSAATDRHTAAGGDVVEALLGF